MMILLGKRYKQKHFLSIMDRVEQMKQIQKEALELFIKKNADYGDAFATFGTIGVLVRIEDKNQTMHFYFQQKGSPCGR